MKRQELVETLDGREFLRILAKAKIPYEAKCAIIKDRSKWLWEAYKPEDMEWHRRIYGKKS